MRLDICLASDDNYAKYMGTTIASILENSEDDEEIYFHLIDGGITEENKNKILSLKKIKNCEIIFYTPDIEKYKKWFEMGSLGNRFSPAIFYRLDIHKIIPNVDKILYLDCDIIVSKSLRELFLDKDLNNYYVFAVEDILDENDIIERIKFEKGDKYFNSGVLMINSKLWRENKIEEQFKEYYYNNTHCYGDQDILNYCLKGKVKFIDKKWNFLELKSCYRTNKPNIDAQNILHFIGPKPLKENANKGFFTDEFWKYYQLTPWFFERPIDAIQTILAQKYSDYEDTKLKINDIKFFGIYHNRNTLQIVFFFIKITVEMSFKNVNKIAWWIPIKKYREAFKRAFDV